MAPSTALTHALDDLKAHDDFLRLNGARRQLVLAAVLQFGREVLTLGNGAADRAGREIACVTGSQRLGDAAALAVRIWADSND